MNKYLTIILILLYSQLSFGQNNTIKSSRQKGLLVLSSYNYLYDYDGGHTRFIGFHDFFFPTDKISCYDFTDSCLLYMLKNGIRVDSIPDRQKLKTKNYQFLCYDSSKCYIYKDIYFIPVDIVFSEFEDYMPFKCERNYFDIRILKGSSFHFEYRHAAINIQRLHILKNK